MHGAALGFPSSGSGWRNPTGIRIWGNREKPSGGDLGVGDTVTNRGALGRAGWERDGRGMGAGEGREREGEGRVVMVLQGWRSSAVVTRR